MKLQKFNNLYKLDEYLTKYPNFSLIFDMSNIGIMWDYLYTKFYDSELDFIEDDNIENSVKTSFLSLFYEYIPKINYNFLMLKELKKNKFGNVSSNVLKRNPVDEPNSTLEDLDNLSTIGANINDNNDYEALYHSQFDTKIIDEFLTRARTYFVLISPIDGFSTSQNIPTGSGTTINNVDGSFIDTLTFAKSSDPVIPVNDNTIISSAIVSADFQEISDELQNKQNKLTAGTGINITNDVISATGGGGVSWGNITGTLSNQTDLNNILINKADTSLLNNYVDLTNNQNISGLKVFANGLAISNQNYSIQINNINYEFKRGTNLASINIKDGTTDTNAITKKQLDDGLATAVKIGDTPNTGNLNLVGNFTQTGNYVVNGNQVINGNLDINTIDAMTGGLTLNTNPEKTNGFIIDDYSGKPRFNWKVNNRVIANMQLSDDNTYIEINKSLNIKNDDGTVRIYNDNSTNANGIRIVRESIRVLDIFYNGNTRKNEFFSQFPHQINGQLLSPANITLDDQLTNKRYVDNRGQVFNTRTNTPTQIGSFNGKKLMMYLFPETTIPASTNYAVPGINDFGQWFNCLIERQQQSTTWCSPQTLPGNTLAALQLNTKPGNTLAFWVPADPTTGDAKFTQRVRAILTYISTQNA